MVRVTKTVHWHTDKKPTFKWKQNCTRSSYTELQFRIKISEWAFMFGWASADVYDDNRKKYNTKSCVDQSCKEKK